MTPGAIAHTGRVLALTGPDQDSLCGLLDKFAEELEADIQVHCIAGTATSMPEDRAYVNERATLWRKCQDWLIRVEGPETKPAFDPAEPKRTKSIP
jgi:hypothetical protein